MAFLDTHKAIERIVLAGASKDLAEAIVESVNTRNDDVATKHDISELRSELKIEISWLKTISIANFGMILGGVVTLLIKHF